MFYKTTLLASLLILFSNLLPAQEFLDIDIKNKCVYSGNHMDEELYSFPTDVTVMENLVKQILELGGDLTANFQVIQTNVENVSAVVDDNKRYLLWSQDFLAAASRIEAWGSTAHEIAHHINKHSLNPELSQIEETEADFFMGFIFFKANFSEEQIMVFVQRMPLSHYAGSKRQRLENIMNGYKKGESGSKFKSLQYENDPSLINFMNAQFPFPPPECHTAYEIPNNYFSNCFDLGAVSKKITLGLEKKQYPYKYMSVPNGFAIVTQMEQYNKDGSLMSGSTYRWVDYPVQESFSLSWNYIKSLIYPKKGYLRLFVFIVTSQNYSSDKKRVSKEDASAWLSQGVNRLPKSIATMPFNSDYSVSFLTYEFEVPESNHRVQQSCPCQHQAAEHFSITGLKELLVR